MGRPRKDPRGFDRVCDTCGTAFVAKNTFRYRFCSHACYAADLRARPGATLEERFWPKVQKTEGCWEWTGVLRDTGYGQIWVRETRSMEKAHRVSWRLHFGDVPKGLFVLH